MEIDQTTEHHGQSNTNDDRRVTEHLKQIIETQSALALAGFDLQSFMDQIVERMLLLTPATGCVVEIVEGTEIVYKATSGSVAPFIGVRLAMANSLTGLSLRDSEIKISTDTSTDPRVDRAACKRVGAASMVLVPLMRSGEPIGVLKVLSNRTNAFSDDDVATLQLMAGLLSGALAQQLEMEQRKQLEEALKQRTQELENRHEQLTEALAALEKASEELELKNLKVQEATRLKSEFLANMSHEIRTPLNAIIGFTDILLRRDLSEQNRSFMENIGDAGRGLLALINDILDFSKIEAGKMTIEMIDFDLEHVVNGTAQLMTQQCQAKGLRLVKDVDALVPKRVIGDPERLRQILVNLLGNAIKFSSSGSIFLEVSCVRADTNSGVVLRFSVIDQGVGLTQEEIAQLFQAFVQADGSTTRKFGGTGLGLSICKHLVELMGGQIGIESVKGEGSEFWFTVPYERAKALEKSAAASPAKTARLDSFKPGLILVADDHPANRMVAQLQLQELGLSAHLVTNGREAIDALTTNKFAAILMDCQMPEMDGFEAARKIRELETESDSRITIIAMTANAMQGDKDACIAAGMDDYVSKPVELKQLSKVLGRWLETSETAQSGVPPDTEKQTDTQPTERKESVVTARTEGATEPLESKALCTIDIDSLVEMFGVKNVCRLLDNLIDTTDDVMRCLNIALASRDREAVFAIAHKLVGSCGTLRADELHLLCEKLNAVAHTEQWDKLDTRCEDIQAAYARLKVETLTYLASCSNKD